MEQHAKATWPCDIHRVVKDTFFKVFKYKILSRNVFEILLSNTSEQTAKIQNTKYLFVQLYLKYKIHTLLEVRSHNTQLVNVRIGFEQQKCFEHVVRQFVAFRTANNAAKAKQAFNRG
jgi:hypothetical protein